MSIFPNLRPMRLSRRPKPFDSDDFLFELKHDGFRAIAFVENGHCQLVSRRGHTFKKFGELCGAIADSLIRAKSAVLDGEIVNLDGSGLSVFHNLMFGRATSDCFFYAFDLLYVNGKDLRQLALIERKKRLRKLIPPKGSRLLYDHIGGRGCALFEAACRMDLEGIVAKRKDSLFV